MELTSFNALIQGIEPAGAAGQYQGRVTEDWLQGRAAFGGLMAAYAVAALRQEIGNERPLRALMTSFVGPAGQGEVDIQATTLRSGKAVTWTEAKISQEGKACTAFSAAFGGSRESSIQVAASERPAAIPPEEGIPFRFIPGVTPNLIQHYDIRWAIGGLPMSSSTQSEIGAWVRFNEPDQFSEAHVVSMMDLLPPAVLQMQSEMKPISSLTWHLEMLDDLSAADAQDGAGWWFFHAEARAAANGYSQQSATLYTPAGRAIAMSQQTIAVFA